MKIHDKFKIKDFNDSQHIDTHYLNEDLLVSKMIEIDSGGMIISESTYNELSFERRLENKVWIKIGDYCYYSVPIFPFSSNGSFDSETTSLLNAIRLKQYPSYAFIYSTKLEVETIECHESDLRHVWSEDITDQLFYSYLQQIKDIKNASAYNAGSERVK